MTSEDRVVVVDLFAGAGGLSTGTARACEDLGLTPGRDVVLHAINHWKPAIETHRRNHPWAEHYHARIEELYPPDVVEPGTVTLLTAGPECTHFSNARGGKPVSDQKRASAWHVLDWIEKLRPEHVLLENVREFRSWGPIRDDGTPSKDGSIFERWIGVLESLGYSVVYDDHAEAYGVVLNAADYGDPQSRERLFIMASRSRLPTAPPRTHSDDPDDDRPPRRPAAAVIDWSDLGTSLWTRDLEHPRVTPLSANTMARIAEGIRRHCDPRLRPFADAIEHIGPARLERLREHVVPAWAAPVVADAIDDPFLVRTPGGIPPPGPANPHAPIGIASGNPPLPPEADAGTGAGAGDEAVLGGGGGFLTRYYGTNHVSALGEPVGTVTAGGNHYGLTLPVCSPYLLGQHTGSTPRSIRGLPVPTVTTTSRGISVCAPEAFVLGQHSNSVARDPTRRAAPTVAAGGKLQLTTTEAFCLRQQAGGVPVPVGDPLSTIAAGGAIGLTTVESRTLVQPKNGVYRGNLSDLAYDPFARPLRTVIANDARQGHLLTPSLVRYSHGGAARPVRAPLPTVKTEKGGEFAVASPFLHQVTHGGRDYALDAPLQTVTSAHRGEFALTCPYLCPLYPERADQRPRTRGVTRPLMAVPASKSPAALTSPYLCPLYNPSGGQPPRTRAVARPLSTVTARKAAPAGLATPFLIQYYGNSDVTPATAPVPTIPTRDRFALCVPAAWPWGLDVKYRMLQPRELKQAQGFPADYEIAGSSKKTRTKLIGNAVPVNLARALTRHLLVAEAPSLAAFGAGRTEDPDATVPAYEEVAQSDD